LLALVRDGNVIEEAVEGDQVEVLLAGTGFYVEAGGQVSDTGTIVGVEEPRWEIQVTDMRKPAAGVIVHVGKVERGHPRVGDTSIAAVDAQRRRDIMRNHTATHLLHAELRQVLGDHARQAGSLVAPDRLRFDFTHPQAVTPQELELIEAGVNRHILGNYSLHTQIKPLQKAIEEGATALFGEKYADMVRNITIGELEVFSNELCGGTHVDETGDIGLFLITSEGSAAAGIRRIEAVTGRGAYELVQRRFRALKQAAGQLGAIPEELPDRLEDFLAELDEARRQASKLGEQLALVEFDRKLESVQQVGNAALLTAIIPNVTADTLRALSDQFRQRYPNGAVVLASVSEDGHPIVIAAVTEALVKRGLRAGDLVQSVAGFLGGGGGGRPTLAQAGGKDASRLGEALENVTAWVGDRLG
jgi:alanyl-tRNA synthetase